MVDFTEIHLILKKISENQAKRDIQQAKIDEQLAKRDIQQAKTEEELRNLIAQQAKTDEQLAKTDEQLAKTDIQQAKTGEELRNLIAQQAKTDKQLAKTDKQLAKTDEQLAKTDEQLAKTDEQLARTDARLEKMIAQQERNNKKMGSIENNMGSTAEEYFYNALEETKKLGNIQFDDIDLNLKGRRKKVQDEFDIVLYNGNSVGIVEIKYKVHPNDLENLIHTKTEHFRTLFPYYKDYQIYLGIGGYSIPEAVVEDAKNSGVAVLRQKGEIIEIEGDKLRAY